MSVTSAAAEGSRRGMLEAMRDRIALAVDDERTPARDLAALTRRLMDIAKELEALASAEGGDDLGEAAGTPDAEFDPAAL